MASSEPRQRTVTHGYLRGSGEVFATHHRPTGPVRNAGYVICPPIGWEAIQCYHSLRLLGETLASAGFHALRIDYQGTGESIGSDEDPDRVAAWVASIHEGADGLAGLPGVETVGLIGIRLGATIVAAAADERPYGALVLWEPCLTGASYAREMEILSAATRRALGGHDASPLMEGGVEAAGYLLAPHTVADLSQLVVESGRVRGTPSVLIIRRDDRPPLTGLVTYYEQKGCATTHASPPGHKEMMVYPLQSKPPGAIFERVREWAVEASSPGVVANGPDDVDLGERASGAGFTQWVFRFGPDSRLFGVCSEPEPSRAPRSPSVVMLSGGIVPRTAVNRMYVEFARRLAARGHRVLRLDVSGIGESFPERGAPPNDAYPAALLDDVEEAIALVTSDRDRGIWLLGLCSGAFAAFQHALVEPRVVGVTLINPSVYYPEAEPSFINHHTSDDSEGTDERSGLLAALRRVSAPMRAAYARLGGDRRRLRGDLRRLVTRGAGIQFVFSKGDPGQALLIDRLGETYGQLLELGMTCDVYEGADHTFNPLRVREALLEDIVNRISSSPGDGN